MPTDKTNTSFIETPQGNDQTREQAYKRDMALSDYIRWLIAEDRKTLGFTDEYDHPAPRGTYRRTPKN